MPITALIRVKEWSAWVPEHPDPNNPDETLMDGTVGLELLDGERILECNVTATGLKIAGISEEDQVVEGQDDEPGVKHQLCIFQALVAGILPTEIDGKPVKPADYVSAQPSTEKSVEVIEAVKQQMRARAAEQEARAAIAAGVRPEQMKSGPPQRGRRR